MSEQRGSKGSTVKQKENEAVQVFVRVRPPENRTTVKKDRMIVRLSEDCTKVIIEPNCLERTFDVDHVFGMTSSQNDVFNVAAKPLVDYFLQGHSGSIIVYGQTNSGKTYTMLGDIYASRVASRTPGIIQTTINYIMNHPEKRASEIYRCSYAEVYNEMVYDLLADASKASKLKIREAQNQQIYIEGLSERDVISVKQTLDYLTDAEKQRSKAATGMNVHSSRSHSIFMLTAFCVCENKVFPKGKLYLVDLAGSEKIKKSNAQNATLDEAKMINRSLSSFAKVVQTLATVPATFSGSKTLHIPYRNSKLTRILQNTIGGDSRICVICTICSTAEHEAETISTLRFTHSLKQIKNVNLNQGKLKSRKSLFEVERELAQAYQLISEKELQNECLKYELNTLQNTIKLPIGLNVAEKDASANDKTCFSIYGVARKKKTGTINEEMLSKTHGFITSNPIEKDTSLEVDPECENEALNENGLSEDFDFTQCRSTQDKENFQKQMPLTSNNIDVLNTMSHTTLKLSSEIKDSSVCFHKKEMLVVEQLSNKLDSFKDTKSNESVNLESELILNKEKRSSLTNRSFIGHSDFIGSINLSNHSNSRDILNSTIGTVTNDRIILSKNANIRKDVAFEANANCFKNIIVEECATHIKDLDFTNITVPISILNPTVLENAALPGSSVLISNIIEKKSYKEKISSIEKINSVKEMKAEKIINPKENPSPEEILNPGENVNSLERINPIREINPVEKMNPLKNINPATTTKPLVDINFADKKYITENINSIQYRRLTNNMESSEVFKLKKNFNSTDEVEAFLENTGIDKAKQKDKTEFLEDPSVIVLRDQTPNFMEPHSVSDKNLVEYIDLMEIGNLHKKSKFYNDLDRIVQPNNKIESSSSDLSCREEKNPTDNAQSALIFNGTNRICFPEETIIEKNILSIEKILTKNMKVLRRKASKKKVPYININTVIKEANSMQDTRLMRFEAISANDILEKFTCSKKENLEKKNCIQIDKEYCGKKNISLFENVNEMDAAEVNIKIEQNSEVNVNLDLKQVGEVPSTDVMNPFNKDEIENNSIASKMMKSFETYTEHMPYRKERSCNEDHSRILSSENSIDLADTTFEKEISECIVKPEKMNNHLAGSKALKSLAKLQPHTVSHSLSTNCKRITTQVPTVLDSSYVKTRPCSTGEKEPKSMSDSFSNSFVNEKLKLESPCFHEAFSTNRSGSMKLSDGIRNEKEISNKKDESKNEREIRDMQADLILLLKLAAFEKQRTQKLKDLVNF